MRLRDGTILMHARAPYDPVKAHAYYMRTRKLKGRRKGKGLTPVKSAGKTSFPVTKSSKTIKAEFTKEQEVYVTERINQIKQRLTELSSRVNKMKAMVREEAKKPVKETPKSKESTKKESTKKESTKKEIKKANIEKVVKTDPVVEFELKVTEIKDRLVAAVAKQRALFAASRE